MRGEGHNSYSLTRYEDISNETFARNVITTKGGNYLGRSACSSSACSPFLLREDTVAP